MRPFRDENQQLFGAAPQGRLMPKLVKVQKTQKIPETPKKNQKRPKKPNKLKVKPPEIGETVFLLEKMVKKMIV